jgi:hypothetical protein
VSKSVSNPELYSVAIAWVNWPVPPTSKYEINRVEINQYMQERYKEATRVSREETVEKFGEINFQFPSFQPTAAERAGLDYAKLKEEQLASQVKMDLIEYIYELLLSVEETK